MTCERTILTTQTKKSARQKHIYLGWIEDKELSYGRPTEWNQKHGFGPEHPYHGIKRAKDIPDVVKNHAQIRKEKAAAANKDAPAAFGDHIFATSSAPVARATPTSDQSEDYYSYSSESSSSTIKLP